MVDLRVMAMTYAPIKINFLFSDVRETFIHERETKLRLFLKVTKSSLKNSRAECLSHIYT